MTCGCAFQVTLRLLTQTKAPPSEVASSCFGVEGENALGESGNTADLIMQNFPYFFVDTAKEMVEFTYAGVVQQNYPAYLAKHKKTNRIINAMEKTESSVLTTTFWGILPFHLGHEVVKYRLTPDTPAENVPNDETTLPRDRLRQSASHP